MSMVLGEKSAAQEGGPGNWENKEEWFPAAASSLLPVRSQSDIHSTTGINSPKMPMPAYAFVRKSTFPNCHLTIRNVLRKYVLDRLPPTV